MATNELLIERVDAKIKERGFNCMMLIRFLTESGVARRTSRGGKRRMSIRVTMSDSRTHNRRSRQTTDSIVIILITHAIRRILRRLSYSNDKILIRTLKHARIRRKCVYLHNHKFHRK